MFSLMPQWAAVWGKEETWSRLHNGPACQIQIVVKYVKKAQGFCPGVCRMTFLSPSGPDGALGGGFTSALSGFQELFS